MDSRELTKEDLDKVRNIEGFPLANDEDIIALSSAPYYTACPNPFIKDFITENGEKYEEGTDDYHREPFTSDVSEGKSDPVYNVHSYHTKVPHKAIMRYIMHYTKPGEVVYDGFCGSGMTGVAAQVCGNRDAVLSVLDSPRDFGDKVGRRKAILSDLSPAATFTAYNYNYPVDTRKLEDTWNRIVRRFNEEIGWLFETEHSVDDREPTLFTTSKKGKINYTVWSDLMICPVCGSEFVFWDVAVDEIKGTVREKFVCPHCHAELKKKDCEKAKETFIDDATGEMVFVAKQTPILINYTYAGKKYDKKPDECDLSIIERINITKIPYWYPTEKMMHIGEKWGDSYRSGIHAGITRIHQFFTKRNLYALSFILDAAQKEDSDICRCIMSAMKSAFSYGTKMIKVNVGRILNGGGLFALGAVSGTLYIPSLMAERNIVDAVDNKIRGIIKLYRSNALGKGVIINTASSTDVKNIPDNSVDYIFTDPPFGDNLNYSELNFIWEAWEKVFTNNSEEAIINKSQNKGLNEYQSLMTQCFCENFRILKPGRWMTVEFHNSRNAVWNAIQEALLRAGFILADVRTLDKKQGSFTQVTNTTSVKQDLIISAYKPKELFIREFHLMAGTEESAWEFVRQHLSNLPIAVDADKDGRIDVIAERQAFLLFDRMVSYHIMQGYAVPLDATDFYNGLDNHFIKRDGMYFLPSQVNEYDMARASMEIEDIQFSLFVSDEKSAIAWLYQQLDENSGLGRMTYAEIQPLFMQQVKAVEKQEKMPELSELLEENFLKNDEGKWYIPDYSKSGDLAKLREKNLLKEFNGYITTRGKIKKCRSEAVKAGFAKLWKDKNYQLIVDMAGRLPEKTVQEDPNILMYYDISLNRI